MKRVYSVLFVLTACAFVTGLVAGFFVTVHAQGVACGAPLEVVDGTYASGVPTNLHDACQSAANRWIGMALIAFFVLFVPTWALAFIDQRRRKRSELQLLDGSDLL